MLPLVACHMHFEYIPAVTKGWAGVQDKKREGWVDPGQAGGFFQEAAVKWVSGANCSKSSYWK